MLSSGRLGVLLLSQVEAALLMPLAWTLDLVEAALLMPLAWTLDLVTSVYAAAFLLSSFFVGTDLHVPVEVPAVILLPCCLRMLLLVCGGLACVAIMSTDDESQLDQLKPGGHPTTQLPAASWASPARAWRASNYPAACSFVGESNQSLDGLQLPSCLHLRGRFQSEPGGPPTHALLYTEGVFAPPAEAGETQSGAKEEQTHPRPPPGHGQEDAG
eukprot:s3390_g5.t1